MKIYNSLTRQKEEFAPIKEGRVGMYVCGPTVYDEPHIGHGRSAYIFDVVRRYFNYKGYKVKFVRNVTDVDDKIIEKAKSVISHRSSVISLKNAVKEVAEKYLDAYHKDMGLLGIGEPDKEPKATEYIGKMIKFIELLIKNGCAYEAQGDVYFDIRKAKDYGKLSNQSLDKMASGARVAPGENKKDPLDFALWKGSKELEPSWSSPWGEGRPGWHIECSVMSSAILGDEFDLHGGGIDLIFPHHENEIAQSEGAGKKFARCWLHNGLLTINGEKMAKSLGNFITIKDFLAKYKGADLLKLLFLNTHYRHPVDYSESKIEEMKKEKERFVILLERMQRLRKRATSDERRATNTSLKDFKKRFENAMDDDFNTPLALGVVFAMVTHVNKLIDRGSLDDLSCAKDMIIELTGVFGLGLQAKKEGADDEILSEIKKRNDARKSGDFARADDIRKSLLAKGIILEDTKDGTVWRRKL